MAMSAKQKLEQLELACRESGIRLMSDDLKSEGGFCRLRDSFYLVINRRASADTRMRLMADALNKVAAVRAERSQAEEIPSPKSQVQRTEATRIESEIRSPKPETRTPEPEVPVEQSEPVGAEVLAAH